jgi:hypothetical protein
MASRKLIIIPLSTLLICVACSKKEPEKVQLFHGACDIQVKSSVKDAEILIDGIAVGHGEAKEKVPCTGQRQVRIVADGYEPVEEYFTLTEGQTLVVDKKLEKMKEQKNYALSGQLVKDIKKGKFSDQPAAAPNSDAPEAPKVGEKAEPTNTPPTSDSPAANK